MRLDEVKVLVALFILSISLTLWLASGTATAEMLFQSPQSPVEQSPVAAPAEQPPAEQPPAEQSPAEQPSDQQSPPEQTSTDQSEPPIQSGDPAPDGSSAEPAAPAEVAPEPIRPDPVELDEEIFFEDEEAGSSNFILDRIELIDTIVVSTAYVWLCCGVLLFLLVPVSLLFLYIRGRGKIAREEGY